MKPRRLDIRNSVMGNATRMAWPSRFERVMLMAVPSFCPYASFRWGRWKREQAKTKETERENSYENGQSVGGEHSVTVSKACASYHGTYLSPRMHIQGMEQARREKKTNEMGNRKPCLSGHGRRGVS